MNKYRVVLDAADSADLETVNFWRVERKTLFGWRREHFFTLPKKATQEQVAEKARLILNPTAIDLGEVA